jgi:hypothetical protein
LTGFRFFWDYFYLMNRLVFILIIPLLVSSCKSKKKKHADDAEFFPVLTYLKGQVAKMDSSVATIIKIEQEGTNPPDTAYLKREEFKNFAKEFLQLPDISSEKLRDDYTVTQMYDDLLNAFVFTYTTTEEDEEIKKQDVILEPGEDGNSEIKTIHIDKWAQKGQTTEHKSMLWEANRRFLIITKNQPKGEPEKIKTLEVKWSTAMGEGY